MKLYYSPSACSVGIHILLEEIGTPFETELLDIRSGQQYAPAFRQINPKSKVPTLIRDDGRALTEFGTIAFWLAQTNPEANLLPADIDGQTRVRELMDFMVSTVHMRGFTFIIAARKFVSDGAAQAELGAFGKKVATDGLAALSQELGTQDYLLGEFGIADAALFYLVHWAAAFDVETPDNLKSFYKRMQGRPAVARVLEREQAVAA